MARIAFLQNLSFEFLGPMYLAAVAGKHGHQSEVFIEIDGDTTKMVCEALNFKPDLWAFSCTSDMQQWVQHTAALIKKRTAGVRIIVGGPHPTFFPDFLYTPNIDIICRGEGEEALRDLCDSIDLGKNLTNIPNLWFKTSGSVIKNDPRPLIEDLDQIPFPDRTLYEKKYPTLIQSRRVFIAGRGCPFSCSYCFNKALKELYSGKGQYVRRRSVNNLVDEIQTEFRRKPFSHVYFQDDTFALDESWMQEFSREYHRRIHLPFFCLAAVPTLTEKMVRALKEAGCLHVFFGIETGNENLRRTALKKPVSNQQIIESAARLHKAGIRFRTYNILGLPGETLEQALETVELNIRIGTDFPWCSLFQPYPGTDLTAYAEQHDLLLSQTDADAGNSFFRKSPIKSDIRTTLENLQKVFYVAVKFPAWVPLLKRVVSFSPHQVFDAVFLISYAIQYLRSERLTVRELIRIARRNVGSFFFSRFKGGQVR